MKSNKNQTMKINHITIINDKQQQWFGRKSKKP